MSATHTSDDRRRSSMTHARRGRECELCGLTVFGNGGKVAHGRGHVRRGEAVELLKEYACDPPMSSRLFMSVGDGEGIAKLKGMGFGEVAL